MNFLDELTYMFLDDIWQMIVIVAKEHEVSEEYIEEQREEWDEHVEDFLLDAMRLTAFDKLKHLIPEGPGKEAALNARQSMKMDEVWLDFYYGPALEYLVGYHVKSMMLNESWRFYDAIQHFDEIMENSSDALRMFMEDE